MKKHVIAAFLTAFLSCYATLVATGCKTGQTPWQNIVTDVTTIVDCTKAACAEAGPVCSQIQAEVLACIPALVTGNPAICASLINGANGKIAYADIICVIDAFSTSTGALGQHYLAAAKPGAMSLPEAQAAAAKWIADQHIGVIRAKAAQ